jgi:hypothetical protein
MKKLTALDTNLFSKKLQQEFCEDFALGKSKKLPHETKEDKKTDKKIIHSDLAGPMKTESYGKKTYMVTYICNKTDYSFVYFVITKDLINLINSKNLSLSTNNKEMLKYKDCIQITAQNIYLMNFKII